MCLKHNLLSPCSIGPDFGRPEGFLAKIFQPIPPKIWRCFWPWHANAPSQAASPPVCCTRLFIAIVTERQIKNDTRKSKTSIKPMKKHLVTVWMFSKGRADEAGRGGAQMGRRKTGIRSAPETTLFCLHFLLLSTSVSPALGVLAPPALHQLHTATRGTDSGAWGRQSARPCRASQPHEQVTLNPRAVIAVGRITSHLPPPNADSLPGLSKSLFSPNGVPTEM